MEMHSQEGVPGYVPQIPVPTKGQEKYFLQSACKEDGVLIPYFHGTGTKITEFRSKMTGNGNDQYGSGFYNCPLMKWKLMILFHA